MKSHFPLVRSCVHGPKKDLFLFHVLKAKSPDQEHLYAFGQYVFDGETFCGEKLNINTSCNHTENCTNQTEDLYHALSYFYNEDDIFPFGMFQNAICKKCKEQLKVWLETHK